MRNGRFSGSGFRKEEFPQRNKYVLLRVPPHVQDLEEFHEKARAISVFPPGAPFISTLCALRQQFQVPASHVLAHEQKKNQQMTLLYQQCQKTFPVPRDG